MTTLDEGGPSGPMLRAAVSVGEVETKYRRAGCGAPVVLLGLRPDTESSLVERLALPGSRWRVLVPDGTTLYALASGPGPEESIFCSWLSGFLQGLGLDRPRVVAAAAFREELARYEAVHPDELGAVLIVDDPEPSAEAIVEQLSRR